MSLCNVLDNSAGTAKHPEHGELPLSQLVEAGMRSGRGMRSPGQARGPALPRRLLQKPALADQRQPPACRPTRQRPQQLLVTGSPHDCRGSLGSTLHRCYYSPGLTGAQAGDRLTAQPVICDGHALPQPLTIVAAFSCVDNVVG